MLKEKAEEERGGLEGNEGRTEMSFDLWDKGGVSRAPRVLLMFNDQQRKVGSSLFREQNRYYINVCPKRFLSLTKQER